MTARILLVDDETDMQELFRQQFRREIRKGTYRFDFASSGEAALEVLRRKVSPVVAMVLSDVNMPGMSGIELLAEIRKEWPTVTVCMITAYGDSGTRGKARNLGAERLFPKPVDFGALKSNLSEALSEEG